MAEFLTPDWIQAMSLAARGAAVSVVDPTIVVQQVVTRSAGDEVSWWIQVGGGAIALHAGRVGSPTVTFTQDDETAAAINQGLLSAQSAFMSGRLRVHGDVQALLDRQDQMLAIEDVFAATRATTTY